MIAREIEEMVPFPSWFKEHRQALGLSQHRMAIRLDTTVATIQNWESGRGRPDADNLANILRVFGYDVPPLGFTSPSGDSAKASKLTVPGLGDLIFLPEN